MYTLGAEIARKHTNNRDRRCFRFAATTTSATTTTARALSLLKQRATNNHNNKLIICHMVQVAGSKGKAACELLRRGARLFLIEQFARSEETGEVFTLATNGTQAPLTRQMDSSRRSFASTNEPSKLRARRVHTGWLPRRNRAKRVTHWRAGSKICGPCQNDTI